jgi:hypothetical protein
MHTFPTMDPYFGFSPAAVIGGFLCGLACFIVGLIKNQVKAGGTCFGVCVFLGAFISIWAAIPAALAMGVLLWFEDRLAKYKPELPAWVTWSPLAFRKNSASITPLFASTAEPSAAAAEELGHCKTCGKGFALKNGAMPPWCPKCGADLKV